MQSQPTYCKYAKPANTHTHTHTHTCFPPFSVRPRVDHGCSFSVSISAPFLWIVFMELFTAAVSNIMLLLAELLGQLLTDGSPCISF